VNYSIILICILLVNIRRKLYNTNNKLSKGLPGIRVAQPAQDNLPLFWPQRQPVKKLPKYDHHL